MKACCTYPAYRDPEGKERIFDTRWDLIEAGFFPKDCDLSFEEMKEALNSPCMVGREKRNDIKKRKNQELTLRRLDKYIIQERLF